MAPFLVTLLATKLVFGRLFQPMRTSVPPKVHSRGFFRVYLERMLGYVGFFSAEENVVALTSVYLGN